MTLTEMKEFAIFYVNEHKLSKEDTIYLYNFIKEADANQLQHLLYTGEPKHVLDEQDLSYIEEVGGVVRHGSNLVGATAKGGSLGNKYTFGAGVTGAVDKNVAIGAGALAVAAIAALAARAGYKVYKDKLSKIGKQCNQYKHGTPDRKKCEAKAKNAALQAQMAAMKATASKCAKSKDPAKCKAAIAAKIEKLKSKMSPAA
jgi:hypothetical protein